MIKLGNRCREIGTCEELKRNQESRAGRRCRIRFSNCYKVLSESWEIKHDPRIGAKEVKRVHETGVNIRKHDPRIGAKEVKWVNESRVNFRKFRENDRIKGFTLETSY